MAILIRAPFRARAAALLALCLMALPAASARAEQRTATAEDDIKATFLFNFTKFVEWPAGTATAEGFRLCTVAEPGFNNALDRTLTGETANGLPIVRLTPATPDAARSCDILFLGRLENERADRWISAVRGAPVLVVGESPAAADRGAHINFVVDDNRVQFDVNTEAARRAGLIISSKLLRVARNVTPRSGA